jgi:hypothetical protein
MFAGHISGLRSNRGDSIPSVIGSRVYAGLPQLRFLADSATAAHAGGMRGRYNAR